MRHLSCLFVVVVTLAMATYAPGAIPEDRYTLTDGTALDMGTGLMWQRQASGPMGWQAALAHCQNLVLEDHDDWRLPQIKEILTLVDWADSGRIDFEVFAGLAGESMWSGTPRVQRPWEAFSYRLNDGRMDVSRSNAELRVLCVRHP